MTSTYEYTYEYEVGGAPKQTRTTGATTHRSVTHSQVSRSDGVDPLANLQHDRIWNKLYDPVGMDKAQHDVEIQKMARRQDRKIIKIEAAHGSDRQTFIVKRDYDLRVRDVIDEASRTFKIPPEQVILYWKGRNICETPDVLLESLGVENNNTMRIARADDQFLQRQRYGQYQQSSSSGTAGFYGSGGSSYSGGSSGQQYGAGGAYGQQTLSSSAAYGQQSGAGGSYGQLGASGSYGQSGSSSGEAYSQSQTTYPSQTYYSSYPAGGYDQQYTSSGSYGGGHHCNCNCHQDQHHGCKCCCHCHGSTNHYQQFTNRTFAVPAAETYILTPQIGHGDRVLGLAIGRQHPITIYDLQVELQQHYNIPIAEQNIAYNGMPLSHLPPDTVLQTVGIMDNAFISLWHRNNTYVNQQQISGHFTPRQQVATAATGGGGGGGSSFSSASSSYSQGGSQSLYDGDMSSRRMYYSNSGGEQMQFDQSQEVTTLEVFHGTDRHVLALRGASNIRIGELMTELQNITTVPVQTQRLYFRGQALQTVKDRTLREAGVDNNAQLRLIGEPSTPRYSGLSARN